MKTLILSFPLVIVSLLCGAQVSVTASTDSISIQARIDADNHAYEIALNAPDSITYDTVKAMYVTYGDLDGYLRYAEDVRVVIRRRGWRIVSRSVCDIPNLKRVIEVRMYPEEWPKPD